MRNWAIHSIRATTRDRSPHGSLGPSATLLLLAVFCAPAMADQWPTYRHDNARSGITAATLTLPLTESWAYHPRHRPESAWGEPNPRPVGGWHGLTEGRRVQFDDALHVVLSDGAVYFGSSADGRVVSLDAKTGQQRWRSLTGGPVRLAPSIWQGNVYVGSDDGLVYCLNGKDGSERWRFRAAPSTRKVLGSGKMVSLWPVRTGVLIEDGTAYFGAGIFPAQGVYMYAVNAVDGTLVWCNDTGGATPQSRISPQGYLLASKDRLFAPLGRVSPAAYDRKDGRLLSETYVEHIIGGTNAVLADNELFTGTEQIVGYDQSSSRTQSSWFWSHQLLVAPQTCYAATGTQLFAVRREAYGVASLQRKRLLDSQRDLMTQLKKAKRGPQTELKKVQTQLDTVKEQIKAIEAKITASEIWRVPCDCEETLLLAGNVLLAGGDKRVLAYDSASGRLLWKGDVDGKARGLAVADGRLFVSSDSGTIHCFGAQGTRVVGAVAQQVDTSPFSSDAMTPVIAEAAERIVRTTGVDRGYCLVLGCGTGRLAYELAQRTELTIYCVEPDLEKVRTARLALDKAGLYGARIMIEHGKLSDVPFSDYFANLIVSESALYSGEMPGDAKEAYRMLKPLGGKICIGQPASATGKVKSLGTEAMQQWMAEGELEGGTITQTDGTWLDYQRGALPGAGSWTHQYAEPGNTTCSDDSRIRCPLGLLWFGDPGPGEMAERHSRAAAPLAINGRLFVLGEGTARRVGLGKNSVMAYDAYNGLKLWERTIGGALRISVTHDAGNWAANDDSLFVAVGDQCLQLDAATGKTRRVHELPKKTDGGPRKWGYVAVIGDVLYGSRTVKGRTADCIFAIDLVNGQLLWKQETEGIAQGAIAISNGRLHFAVSHVTKQQREQALSQQVKEVHRLNEVERAAVLKKINEATVYNIITLDARSGDRLWARPVEITGAVGGAYWCSLGAICKDDVLLLFGVFLDGHYWTQFLAGQFEGRQVVALSAKDGATVWRKPIGYRVRPIVVGDTLHAEPWAYDLKTGMQRMRVHPVTGREEAWQFARPGHHCGAPAAAPHMLLFRSFNLGWYDLDNDFGTQHFGGQRPGCWINFIPANGLVMMPEASSGCMCPFPTTCTVVFKGSNENRQWAYFSQPGSMTPVRQLALNLGAPGDRKDNDGLLWLGYPRPRGSLVLQYRMGLSLLPGWSYFKHDPARLEIAGTDSPWVFRSGVSGIRQCKIPVAEPVDGKARYRVRLAFAELEHNAAGKRVFDIKIQGKVVAKDFDVFQQAGGGNRAVSKEFTGIETNKELTIEFVPKVTRPARDQLPILQGIEVQREQVLTLGLAAPAFLLNDAEPKQAGEVVIVNNKDKEFVGTLRIDAPRGFAVTPDNTSLTIASGQRAVVTLRASVGATAKPGTYPLGVKLFRKDGVLEHQQQTTLEHLGNRRRVTLKAIEDSYVVRSAPTKNFGTSKGLTIDGGDRTLGDLHHGIAYLKFRIELPGTPVTAKLRLYNADNPSANSGQIRVAEEPWEETRITYNQRPKLGDTVGTVGAVKEYQIVTIPLNVALEGVKELSLAIDPTGCDGIHYVSREGGKPPELILEYVE